MWKVALLVEDDPAIARAVQAVLRAAGWSTHLAGDVATALKLVEHRRFSAAIVDLGLPDGCGLDVITGCRGRWPAMPVLVLTVASAWCRVHAALQAGAAGYLLKEDICRRLAPALHELLQGGCPLSAQVARDLVVRTVGPPCSAAAPGSAALPDSTALPFARAARALPMAQGLSARENDVLALLARGQTYDEIAACLKLSANTVRTHVRSLYDKLGVHNRTMAVRTGQLRGLLRDPGSASAANPGAGEVF